MSSKYKVFDNWRPHFIISTVIGWVDALSREEYKEIIIKSLQYCIIHKGLVLHAWVIMNNHIHLVVSATNDSVLPEIIRDFKKHTSRSIVEAIIANPQESRKEWLLNMFGYAGKTNSNNVNYQFWKQDYHPIELSNSTLIHQKIDYLHDNPVRAGIVWQAEHYKYSSAIDYYNQKPGLLKIDILV